jgi:hypothetical protein
MTILYVNIPLDNWLSITGVLQCVPIPWRTVNLPKSMRLGVLWDDGLGPTPKFLWHPT